MNAASSAEPDFTGRCSCAPPAAAAPDARMRLAMLQVGKKFGNQMLDDQIMEHVRMKRITPEDAYENAIDKKKFRPLLAHPPEEDEIL